MRIKLTKTKRLLLISFLLISIITSTKTIAQGTHELKLFIECNQGDCYYNYIREQMPAIDFVRDRLVSDVHILSKSQYTQNQNENRVLFVIGRGDYQDLTDTIYYTVQNNATLQQKRDMFLKYVEVALIPYMYRAGMLDDIDIKMHAADSNQTKANEKDPWNLWVFRLSGYGNLNGSRNYNTKSLQGGFDANRESVEQKSQLSLSYSYTQQIYRPTDTTELIFDFKQFTINSYQFYKLKEHWGAGVWATLNSSLYSNYRYRIAFGPRFEYSFFPYSEFNTKRLLLVYDINPVFNKYYDTTIYNKTKETLFNQSLSLITQFTYAWGDLNLGVFYNNYLHNWSLYALGMNAGANIKITKGLNFSIWGNYNLQYNQINLRKSDFDIDQLLVQNRELYTTYNFDINIGLSYRFGSTVNNAVSPIFRGLSYSINF